MNENVAVVLMLMLTMLIGVILGYQLGTYHGALVGAEAVYEKSMVCEQALDEWVCKKVEEL